MREVGGGGARGAESEGWSGNSRESDAKLEEEHALLATSPWVTQESGARGLRGGARAGGSGGGNVTSGTADEGGAQGRHGARKEHGGKQEGRRGWERADP